MDEKLLKIFQTYGLDVITDPSDPRFVKGTSYNPQKILSEVIVEKPTIVVVGPVANISSRKLAAQAMKLLFERDLGSKYKGRRTTKSGRYPGRDSVRREKSISHKASLKISHKTDG